VALTLTLAACERPPVDSVQRGYRGTGMVLVYNPAAVDAAASANAMPVIDPAARSRPNGPKASMAFKNLQVLGDLSLAEFGRTMNAITAWVAPVQSCTYCHVEGDFVSDAKYTKVVSRQMLLMTQAINSQWVPHVAATGVTCYTCHRGQPLPAQRWFRPLPQDLKSDFIGDRAGQNEAAADVGLTSLPASPFGGYLESATSAQSIRVAGTTSLPTGNRSSIQQTEGTYALMMHMSKALGVNCNFCHNSRSFGNWAESAPQRVTAWQGLRMVRSLNETFLLPLTAVFPPGAAGRLGPTNDVGKLNCATCHQGAYKPLYGAQMAQHYPALTPSVPAD
jgi:photosynthetic reaction center cytochrome c subunit